MNTAWKPTTTSPVDQEDYIAIIKDEYGVLDSPEERMRIASQCGRLMLVLSEKNKDTDLFAGLIYSDPFVRECINQENILPIVGFQWLRTVESMSGEINWGTPSDLEALAVQLQLSVAGVLQNDVYEMINEVDKKIRSTVLRR